MRRRRLGRAWRRVRLFAGEFRWAIVVLDVIFAASLGFAAFTERYPEFPLVDRAFFTFKLFLFDPGMAPPLPWKLRVAFVLAGSVTAFASIRTLTSVLSEQSARLRVRLFFRNHVVVCGAGEGGGRVAVSFARAGVPVAVIEPNPAADGVGACRNEGCVVLIGNATDPTTLRQAGVNAARWIVAASGADSINADIASATAQIAPAGATCVVRLSSPELCELLRDATLRTRSARDFRMEFIHELDAVGPALVAEYVADDGPPEIAVIGLGPLGTRLAVHTVRRWAADPGRAGARMSLAVGGPGAPGALAMLTRRYPAFANVADVTVVDEGAEERDLASVSARGVIFVCLERDADTLAMAVRLARALPAPVVACTTGEIELDEISESNLNVVSIPDRVFRAEVVTGGALETIARAIHEDYVRNQAARGSTVADNASLRDWDDLPETLRDSNRAQAAGINEKLATCGYAIAPWTDWEAGTLTFTPEEIETMARAEHDRWWKEREADGWRLGAERDAAAKTSPYLVGYEELAEDVKELDRDTVRGLPGFLATIGYRVARDS